VGWVVWSGLLDSELQSQNNSIFKIQTHKSILLITIPFASRRAKGILAILVGEASAISRHGSKCCLRTNYLAPKDRRMKAVHRETTLREFVEPLKSFG
jgi:hypothetical protein